MSTDSWNDAFCLVSDSRLHLYPDRASKAFTENDFFGTEDQANLRRKQVGQIKEEKNCKHAKPQNSPPKNPKQSTNAVTLERLCDLSQVGVEELRKPQKTEVMSAQPRH